MCVIVSVPFAAFGLADSASFPLFSTMMEGAVSIGSLPLDYAYLMICIVDTFLNRMICG